MIAILLTDHQGYFYSVSTYVKWWVISANGLCIVYGTHTFKGPSMLWWILSDYYANLGYVLGDVFLLNSISRIEAHGQRTTE